jgi:hypothetical protein
MKIDTPNFEDKPFSDPSKVFSRSFSKYFSLGTVPTLVLSSFLLETTKNFEGGSSQRRINADRY